MATTDILDDLIDKLDNARRYEDYIASNCPFHEDNRPSFIVHSDFYKCLSCDAHGSTKSLLDKLSGVVARPQTEYWRNPWTTWLKNDTLSQVLKSSWETNKRRPSIYLRNRGIPAETQIRLGIGQLDDWITFPIRNKEGKIIGAVARAGEGNSSPSKYVVPAGQDPNMIYVPDWKLFDKSSKIYCVFGIIDAVSLSLYEVSSFSTTGGKRIDPSALDFIRKRIIFLPDKGEEKEASIIASKLDWRGCMARMNYPDDTKDVNDVLVRHPELLREQFYGK